MSDLRVGIDVSIEPDGKSGGVETYIAGLISGLSKIERERNGLEFVLIVSPRHPNWVDPYKSSSMEVVQRPWKDYIERIRSFMGPFEEKVKPYAKPVVSRIRRGSGYQVPTDDSYLQELSLDVVHFLRQYYVHTDHPTLFNPHDLQHRQYPEYFSDLVCQKRDKLYSTAAEEATFVDVPSQATKNDLVKHYGINSGKIQPVPLGPAPEPVDDFSQAFLAEVKKEYNIPESFMLYPAKTWPHKNHKSLLEAMAYVKQEFNEELYLVCTGRKSEHWEAVDAARRQLGVEANTSFLGFIDKTDLQALFQLSRFLVYPSLFEGGGLPIFEAWQADTPVVCSNVKSLPEKAGDAAMYFDPNSVADIAETVRKVWNDAELRSELTDAGHRRRERFTWRRTAHLYYSLYKAAAGISLSDEEEEYLQYSPE